MLKELFTAALGMTPQQTRMEVTANNLANANTTGFKRGSVFERNLIDARANFYNVPGDVEDDDPPIGSYVDFSAGSFEQTSNPLDVAIDTNGFFVVSDEDGNQYFTRNGHFELSQDGTIIAKDGKALMGRDGPINISKEFASDKMITRDTTKVDIKITESGEVFANDFHAGTIQIARVENLYQINKVSDQDFVATDGAEITMLDPEEVMLRQGWLEGSNVDVVKEMVTMIELQRMFEAGSKVIHTNNETLDRSISLGRYY
ncbi:MAG: flagellar hook-basal body protein [Candidatus Kapaibacterium sp.]